MKRTSFVRSNVKWTSSCLTFKGVLIHHEQTVDLHLFTKGGLVGRGAAGEEFAGAHAAGESLEGCGFRSRGRSKSKEPIRRKLIEALEDIHN